MSRKTKMSITLLILLILYFYSSGILVVEANDSQYEVRLESGAQVLEIKSFNPNLWESVISANSSPVEWYDGRSNITGAQSKFTDVFKLHVTEVTSSIFKSLYFQWFDVPYLDILEVYGYDYKYIDTNYDDEYEVIFTYRQYWDFQNQPFNQFPHTNQKESICFLNISQFHRSLINFNQFASIVNNDTNIQALGFSLPILTTDELIWQYINDFQILPTDVLGYLQDLVISLACENITISENHLTFYRIGNEQYKAHYYFNKYGKIENILIQNSVGDLIFEIVSFYPRIPLLIITGVCIGISVVFIIFLKWKINKTRKICMK